MQFHLQSSQVRWTKQAISKTTYMISYKKLNELQSYPAGWAMFHQCTENYIKTNARNSWIFKRQFCNQASWCLLQTLKGLVSNSKSDCIWIKSKRKELMWVLSSLTIHFLGSLNLHWLAQVAQCHPSQSKVWFERPSRGLITQSDCESAWPIPCMRSFWWKGEVSWWLLRVFPHIKMLWRGRCSQHFSQDV